jgi:hypothetical protein
VSIGAYLRNAIVLAALLIIVPAGSHAQDASSTIFGSCNIVQQNVTVPSGSTVINQVDCTPQRPEDSFALRYVWLDEVTSSLMIAGHFDPSLRPLVGSIQTVFRNQVYHELQTLTQRFGNASTQFSKGSIFEKVEGHAPKYSIAGAKEDVELESHVGVLPTDALRRLKLYDGSQPIILPDSSALSRLFATAEGWPDRYKMTYYTETGDLLTQSLSGTEAEASVFQCMLLYRFVARSELEQYWGQLEELERFATRTPLTGDATNRRQGYIKSAALRNKAVGAMLHLSQKSWPDDFLLAFSKIYAGGESGCEGPYSVEFYALPRKIFTLAAIIEAVKDAVEVQGMAFDVDRTEGLHTLKDSGGKREKAPMGAVVLKKGETLVIPLRIELRYNPDEYPVKALSGAGEATQLREKISELPVDLFRFRGYEWNEKGGRARTLFAKRKEDFRKPESSSLVPTYVFGRPMNYEK